MTPSLPGLHNLNIEALNDSMNDMTGIVAKADIQFGLAQEIIGNALGPNFWQRECTTFGKKQPFMASKSAVVMMHLAHMLWSLKDAPGFEDFLKRADMKKIEGAYYELYVATMFTDTGSKVEFNKPKLQKGADFDLLVSNFRNFETLNVEVKARNQVFPDQSHAINKLGMARRQLPPQEAGAIVMKIKASDRSMSNEELDAAIVRFLGNTDRVKFVTYIYDRSKFENSLWLTRRTLDKNGPIDDIYAIHEHREFSFVRDLKDYEAARRKA